MIAIYTIPSYLPQALRSYLEPLIEHDKRLNAIYPLERLISYLEMKEVWSTLATFCPEKVIIQAGSEMKALDVQPLIDFLAFVNSHPSLSGKPHDFITIPSEKVQQKAYRSIQKDVESIIATLQTLSEVNVSNADDSTSMMLTQNRTQKGWGILVQAIQRCESTPLLPNKIGEPKQLADLIFSINHINENCSIQEVLETMAFAANAASLAKESNLPTRRNTPRAKINSFILALTDYFVIKYKQPYDELVAITTNVAFDLDDEVTQNMIYKLRSSSKREAKSDTIK